MKKILTTLLLAVFLVSCGAKNVEDNKPKEKSDFYIETVQAGDLQKKYLLQKSSKVEASDEVVVSSEAMGKVRSITVKEGDKVKKWQNLVYISDTVININTNYQQALLNLDKAKIAYNSNKITLDKAVFDTKIQVEQLENSLKTTKDTIAQNIRQAKDNYDNADVDAKNSKSSLDIEKMKNAVAKMELDYNNQVQANKEQINTFIVNLQKEKDNLANLLRDVNEFNNELFRIWPDKEKAVYEVFLGTNDPLQRDATEKEAKNLMDYEKNIFLPVKIQNVDDIQNFIIKMDETNVRIKKMLDDTKVVLNNSVISLWQFSEAERQGFLGGVNGYIAKYQGLRASFEANKNATTMFLNTYENKLESIREQIKLAQKDIEIAKKSLSSLEVGSEVALDKLIISSKDAITKLELQIKTAKNTYENAKQTREATLRNLENTIQNAQLAVQKAGNEVNKLVVSAPISGVVAKVKVNEWQTYPTGTPFLTILSDSDRELDVFLPTEDIEKIKVWEKVNINYQKKEYKGKVLSISTLADKNLNYRVKIDLEKDIQLVGGIAEVSFDLQAQFPLIPINAVSILETLEDGTKKAEIQVFENDALKKQIVNLRNVYGDKIELLTELEPSTQIILNDTSKFNVSEQVLRVKSTPPSVSSSSRAPKGIQEEESESREWEQK